MKAWSLSNKKLDLAQTHWAHYNKSMSKKLAQTAEIKKQDTSRDRLRELIVQQVEMSPAEKLKRAMELSSLGLKMKWQSLRRENPLATSTELRQLYEDWLYRRDAAPFGDCPGSQRQTP